MLIKAADDKQPDIEALEALTRRPDADARTRERIQREIVSIRAGAAGERDAAYEIEFRYGQNKNRMTIHDLRIELDGRVAQIDHLIINRLLDVWICESKTFGEGVAINDRGEFEAFYGRRRYGIPSPIAQNGRHLAVLNDVFEKGVVSLPRRLGVTIKPHLASLVLVSSRARITRPRSPAAKRVEGLDSVIKVDQLWDKVEDAFDQHGIAVLGKVVGQGTIETLAQQLADLHVPAQVDWAARYGLASEHALPTQTQAARRPAEPGHTAPASASDSRATERPVCARCGAQVSDKVISFCQADAASFGGAVYCYDCQRLIRRSK